MKSKIRKHIKNELLIDKINENHGYPIYPISKDDFENLLKKVVDDEQVKFETDSDEDRE